MDGRSDVYSLGVVLYELLTGEVPFRGVARMVLQQIQYEEPRPPRRLNDRVPRDLETIALKCLAKEPGRRYATAGELAADLQRYRRGEPIVARPVGCLEKSWRWAKRNPRVAGLSAAVAALLVLLAAGSTVAAVLIGRQRDAALEARALAQDAQQEAEANAAIANEQRALALDARRQAEANAVVAGEQRDLALEALTKLVFEVQEQMQGRPALQKTRENLLKIALNGLKRLAPGDKPLRADHGTAIANAQLGDLYMSLGKMAEARQHYERCRDVAEVMHKADPHNILALRDLAQANGKLGEVSRAEGNAAVGRGFHHKALEWTQEWVKSDPQSNLAKLDLLHRYLMLGTVQLQTGETVGARESHQKTLELARQLVRAEPRNREYQRALGSSYFGLGKFHHRLGELPAAGNALRQALEVQTELVAADPKNTTDQHYLLLSHSLLGYAHLDRNEVMPARQAYGKAVEVGQALVQDDPQNAPAWRDLCVAYAQLAETYIAVGELATAEKYHRLALERRKQLAAASPHSAADKMNLSYSLERLGFVNMQGGNLVEARTYYRQAFPLREALAADPADVDARAVLAVLCLNAGFAEVHAREFAQATGYFERGATILRALETQGKLKGRPQYERWLRHHEHWLTISKAADRAIDDLEFAATQPLEQSMELLVIRAAVLAGRGQHEQAAQAAERLRRLGPCPSSYPVSRGPLLCPLRGRCWPGRFARAAHV